MHSIGVDAKIICLCAVRIDICSVWDTITYLKKKKNFISVMNMKKNYYINYMAKGYLNTWPITSICAC